MNVGGARKDERLWRVGVVLSLVGVYASGNELQRGQAADWLESDMCLCWPERLLLQPLPLSYT